MNWTGDLNGYLTARRQEIDAALIARLEQLSPLAPAGLLGAMRYTLMGGGKRLRPILATEFGRAAGGEGTSLRLIQDVACSLEWVHAYSLVHDDLPAMDNDDLRHGQPTVHRRYSEGLAILVGDALLTGAFGMLAQGQEPARLKLCGELAVASGASGMVGGQALDVAEDRAAHADYILRLHRMKTGALIRSACRMGVIAAEGSEAMIDIASHYGTSVGLAFQIADDLLDVTSDSATLGKPAGADAAAERATFPAIWGYDKARAMAREQIDAAVDAVSSFEKGNGPLSAVARFCLERHH